MKRSFLAACLTLAACAHPEDRRWSSASFDAPVAPNEAPTAKVYAFAPPGTADPKSHARDLSGEGQAAFIEAMTTKGVDGAALLKALAAPFGGDGPKGGVDRSRLDRTLVITVAKGAASLPGDRLMRTVVTITPHRPAGQADAPFEFAGYRIAATDTKTQNIAHLEDQTDLSLDATLAPKSGGFGDNKVEGKVANTRKSTADIVQQYENLSVDIAPDQMVVTRESERGLDVTGNTLVALMLAAPTDGELAHSAYLATGTSLYENGQALPTEKAKLDAASFRYFARCPLQVDVTLHYQLRRIVRGREFYTEGKQQVAVVSGDVTGSPQTLVRAGDAQGALYQILDSAQAAVLVQLARTPPRRLQFDNFDDANRMAAWLSITPRSSVGKDGPALSINGAPLAKGGRYQAMFYSVGCPA